MKKITFRILAALCLFAAGTTKIDAQWTSGQNATYVLGQPNFSTSSVATTDSTFCKLGYPLQACPAIDPKHHCLYILDFFSSRILRFSYPVTGNQPKANLVIGQPDFVTNTNNTNGISDSSLYFPGSITVDSNTGTLFVADNGNQRILRFDSAYKISRNMPQASGVLGQTNFTSSSIGCTATTIEINNGPITGNLVYFDQFNKVLWFADNANNRVLRFDSALTKQNGGTADVVLGQPDFITNTSGSGAAAFSRPDGLTTIGSSLYVTDASNNRILRFDNVMTLANGASANAVLGQSSFAGTGSGTSQTQLALPSGLASDASGALYVADLNNNRYLIFKNANSLANGAPADFVLLQSTFGSSTSGSGQNGGGSGSTIAADYIGNQVVLLDRANNRFLVFMGCGSIYTQPKLIDTLCQNNPVSISVGATNGFTYQWQENQGSGFNNLSNAGIYSGVTSSTLTISSASLAMNGYRYRCILTGGCTTDTSSESLLAVSVCTGVNNIWSEQVSIYPNPSKGEFTIRNLQGKNEIAVFNMLGEKVYANSTDALQFSVDLSSQPAGVYYIKVTTPQGTKVLNQKLIKE